MTRPLATLKRLRWSSFAHKCSFVTCIVTAPSTVIHHRDIQRSPSHELIRLASSSSRWKSRQKKDQFSKDAKLQGLKSRAAFKLLEINEKYKLFKKGFTVIDLGYAPGSWSQVAINRTAPNGRVIGIDIIPAQPPKGVSTIQGNFLSPEVQAEVRSYIQDPQRGRARPQSILIQPDTSNEKGVGDLQEALEKSTTSYIDLERQTTVSKSENEKDMTIQGSTASLDRAVSRLPNGNTNRMKRDEGEGRVVDVVLSDMSAPWEQSNGPWKRSFSDPYRRMMNTSGTPFRDHVGSMDLCLSALSFCYDTLRVGGHFVCKFYAGAEDNALEKKIKRLFEKVYREKPGSSRSESKEAYFVGIRRKNGTLKEDVFRET